MPILYLLLVLQAGLVITGGAVRIAGSGLGVRLGPNARQVHMFRLPDKLKALSTLGLSSEIDC